MSDFNPHQPPGFQPRRTATEKQIWWSGRGGQNQIATRQVTIAATAVDTTNTPTTTLRAGLVLALNSSTGKAHAYDPTANDGTQVALGVLERPVEMLVDGVATERFAQVIVQGMLKESELIGLDARGRQQLAPRFLFDRHLDQGAGPLMQPRVVRRVSANTNVTADDNGALFVATAAVEFTLPTAANGLAFRFLQSADQNLTIAGSNLLHRGNAAATQVAFSTSSQKIGSHVLVECLYIAADQLRWVVSNLGGTTATIS